MSTGNQLLDLLERLDEQNWERIAHRVSVETGLDVSPEEVREVARQGVVLAYLNDQIEGGDSSNG